MTPRLQMAVVQINERTSQGIGFVVGSFFRRRSRGREGHPTVTLTLKFKNESENGKIENEKHKLEKHKMKNEK